MSLKGEMAELKVYLSEELERRFRKLSMRIYGYGRGSLSKAAEEALRRWCLEMEEAAPVMEEVSSPVEAMTGLLKGVGKSGVELQHEARRLRASRLR